MAARCESLLLLSLSMLLSVGKKRTSLSVYFDSFLSSCAMLGARGAARLRRHCRARRRRTELVCTIGHRAALCCTALYTYRGSSTTLWRTFVCFAIVCGGRTSFSAFRKRGVHRAARHCIYTLFRKPHVDGGNRSRGCSFSRRLLGRFKGLFWCALSSCHFIVYIDI